VRGGSPSPEADEAIGRSDEKAASVAEVFAQREADAARERERAAARAERARRVRPEPQVVVVEEAVVEPEILEVEPAAPEPDVEPEPAVEPDPEVEEPAPPERRLKTRSELRAERDAALRRLPPRLTDESVGSILDRVF
jgi:hypothetical protein